MNIEQMAKINKFLSLLSDSGVCDLLKSQTNKNEKNGGRPTVDPYNLLAGIIFCFCIWQSFTKVNLIMICV